MTKKAKSSKRVGMRRKASRKGIFLQFTRTWQNKTFMLFIKSSIAGLIISTFLISIFILYCAIDLPDIEKLSEDNSRPHIIIRAETEEILAHYGDIYGRSLTYEQLPQTLIDAVLATEDRRFFDHVGIDYFGIIRAAYKNKIAGKVVQGGSTITQQLAKIIFLSAERTIKRKVQEALLAIQLERLFSKEQILVMYLNRVFLGNANYGVDAAARNYFGKRTETLTLYESAFIAGMLKAPSRYAPPGGTEVALNRAKQVLLNMVAAGFISKRQMETAAIPNFINNARPSGLLVNQFFTDYVLSELPKLIPNIKQDLDIHTTFSLEIQHNLEKAITKTLEKDNISKKVQVAAIVMNKNGGVKAMMGGRSYVHSQFNRAVAAKRQPGSIFKLFVYLTALENGYSADSYIEDEEIKIGKWTPKNFSRKYMGTVSLIDAFAYSLNTVAIKLSESVSREKVISMAEKLGIEDNLKNLPSLTLGTSEVTLLDLVSCYAVIANDGMLVNDSSILNISNSNKKTIYHLKRGGIFDNSRVLEDNIVSQIKDMLAASVMYGTSKNAAVPGHKVYGKTGTSQDHRDAWFIGIVDDLVLGIWVGNDDNTPMNCVTGGTLPANIFKEFMKMR
ncbi:MAG: transglycosylase domain-containing protein [Candidatus Midichloria sp.]|uniref:peptidoglycan glycosyltransferase n=1 Tax=Hyalomma marginatum TaxID=34627 RepID=A0A8S4BVD0_9ACAR|nr:PBP1A family penicillin-binding protein [Hyalomma marginatum]CAG7590969.1 PBP1A family penicillin-binding protein [Hyalomma marginatum]